MSAMVRDEKNSSLRFRGLVITGQPAFPILLLVATVPLFAACSLVTVRGGDVEREGPLLCGVVRNPEGLPIAVDRLTLGLGVSAERVLIGFGKESVVSIGDPERCQAIFIVNDEVGTESLKRLLVSGSDDLKNICVVQGEMDK
ncbi:hypothetical protein ED208_00820 [Stagnimonas aquatica]|uniref:Uncharacterized protein n=1 Tax=Stagnimonas aquatica TaxID=2689987 RepID=A0A3N0VK81_9GAMM|nr:hypothetical protein [Stagnimonas aquatica]ROH93110.1 hypothetical protein ED208_00820 [Stagnimonas aquatica]